MWTAVLLLTAALGDSDCLACHEDAGLTAESGRSVHVAPGPFKASVHGEQGCVSCHDDVKEIPHASPLAKPDCGACHADVKDALAKSVHRGAEGPSCASCHGGIHAIRPVADPNAATAKARLPETCGACHADPAFQARHKTTIARPVEAYSSSVHGRAILRGNGTAASCSDCHGAHDILPARDPVAKVNRTSIPATCGACHGAVQAAFEQSVHGKAVRRGVAGAPVCTDCHGEHAILAPSEPGSLVHPARVSSLTCGRCHGDERLAAKYNLPRDKVPAFESSYHGLALRSGQQHVANCASCHGVHNILPSDDPKSKINAANLAATCGACHPGAGSRFALGPVHVTAGTASEHGVVRSIRWFYFALIPATLGLMLLHHGLDFGAKLVRGTVRHEDSATLPRMGLHFRVAHGITVLSFPVLALTGFALKFPDAWWARPLLAWEGNVAVRGLVHRGAGVVLLTGLAYHVIHLVMAKADRRMMKRMLPGFSDPLDAWQMIRFNLGLSSRMPKMGVFSYAEKMEYWAYLWGTVLMAGTGFVLWFDSFALRNLPKWVSDAATAAHYYEAILATGAILVWHFYLVIFDPDVYPMERAWWTGRVSAAHLRRHRPAYYRALVLAMKRKKRAGGP
jgi:cytochrome b subunit of formate dehydrogenase